MTRPSYEATSNAVTPVPPAVDADGTDLVEVFLTVAVRCSDGAHHGVHRVPRAEASRLIAARLAVGGSNAPRWWNLPVE
jgi:hypothetical protein